jgi:hypothetical protein
MTSIQLSPVLKRCPSVITTSIKKIDFFSAINYGVEITNIIIQNGSMYINFAFVNANDI